jgi:hypothetical protein
VKSFDLLSRPFQPSRYERANYTGKPIYFGRFCDHRAASVRVWLRGFIGYSLVELWRAESKFEVDSHPEAAVGFEPVSGAKFPDNREKYREIYRNRRSSICESAWGSDADRHAKLVIHLTLGRVMLGCLITVKAARRGRRCEDRSVRWRLARCRCASPR